MKKKILLITSFLLLIMLAGCRSSASSNKKLPLTKENVQKVFANEYDVLVDTADATTAANKGRVAATFVARENVNRKDSPKLIKDILEKLHENFDIGSDNIIQLNYNSKLLGRIESDSDKVVIGETPVINFENEPMLAYAKRSINNKNFDLLKPAGDVKVTATDDEDGDITNKVKLKNSIDLNKVGSQTLIYEVTDSDGNTKEYELNIEITE